MHTPQLVRYDPQARYGETMASFEVKLKDAQRNLRKKYGSSTSTAEAAGTSQKEHGGDLVKMQLEQLSQQVNQFLEDVKGFASPHKHFTKEYRALTTLSGDLQMNLDRIKIDAAQHQDDMSRKKDLICKVDDAVAVLKTKVHDDGQLCKRCPVTTI